MDVKEIEEIKFKNDSFPLVKISSYDKLIFNYSYKLSQNKFNSAKTIINEQVKQKDLIEAFKYDNTNLDIIKMLNQIDTNIRTEETNDYLKLYNPLLIYDYNKKIFNLINLLVNYNEKNIFNKLEIEETLTKEFTELQEIIDDLNKEISYNNKEMYFATIYYNCISRLMKKLNESKNESKLIYCSIQNNGKNDYHNENNNHLNQNYVNSLNCLYEKINKLNSDIKNFLNKKETISNKELLEEIDKEINKEKKYELLKQHTDFCEIKNEKITQLQFFYSELNKYINCINSIDNYFIKFYKVYLYSLKQFLSSIPMTLDFIYGLDYSKKQNIILLNKFIFFLSNINFENRKNIDDIVQYYETNFKEFNKEDVDEITDEYLISNNEMLIGYKKLNLNYCDLLYLKENRFLYEKYIKFNLFPESNLFFQYKNIYKQFFLIYF